MSAKLYNVDKKAPISNTEELQKIKGQIVQWKYTQSF